MELAGEIEILKKLTELTNNIEILRKDMNVLILSRKALMDKYLHTPLTEHLDGNEEIPPIN